MRWIKRYFVTGLLIWTPLAITVWVLSLLIGMLEGVVPEFLSSNSLFGVGIPGFPLLLVVLTIFLTGVLAANFLGQALVERWEWLLGRIPLVRSIYNSVKQVSDTILSTDGQAFRQALLVQYPRPGVWTIGFVTGAPASEVRRRIESDMLSVYVPTTPNPTSGFFLMMPREQTIELDMSVDQALKYVVSMGVVAPADSTVVPRRPAVGSDP